MPSATHSPSPNIRSPRLLIVDDMAHVRKELRQLIRLSGEVEIVGEAGNGQEAIHQAEALRPDVVLMDLEMPVLDGWEAIRQIKERRLAGRIVALSIHSDIKSKQNALSAGADVFFPKGVDFSRLLEALIANEMKDGLEEDQ